MCDKAISSASALPSTREGNTNMRFREDKRYVLGTVRVKAKAIIWSLIGLLSFFAHLPPSLLQSNPTVCPIVIDPKQNLKHHSLNTHNMSLLPVMSGCQPTLMIFPLFEFLKLPFKTYWWAEILSYHGLAKTLPSSTFSAQSDRWINVPRSLGSRWLA